MEGEIDDNALLDCAVFHIAPTRNSYEAVACNKGVIENVASGRLDQLQLHLLQAKECCSNSSDTSFKLQLAESEKGILWFTKGTLARFLHIVNEPEALKVANAVEAEMAQLEGTRLFHISLYAKDQDRSGSGTKDINCFKEVGINQQIKVETASSDATKNELLRALELRLLVLKDELSAAFNRAAGVTCSAKQISDLSDFSQHFGAVDLRNFLLKLLARRTKDCTDPSSPRPISSQDTRNNNDSTGLLQTNELKPVTNLVSPAKIAQAERQSSSEGEESSDSSNEDEPRAERSRSLMRSATPRRSASPMRRVQIGRSGSRRSTSISIKSLNYFPAREITTTSIRDAMGSNSGDEVKLDQPPKKPENPVRRMSVQDAISLFESKQKDQNSDVQQKRKGSVEVSATPASKSVLRRWSSGMGDSLTSSVDTREVTITEEVNVEPSNETDKSVQVAVASEVENVVESAELITSNVEEVKERAIDSAEWSRQKEAELNQMMKMMESKPGKNRGTNGVSVVQQVVPSEQRGGFYSQYKEKRDEKLRAENAGKRAVKEEQFKVMKETLERSKAQMASKATPAATTKRDSPKLSPSQRPRRNSSPPVLPNKEVLKPTGTKKASPKTSPLPSTRSSWSSSLPKTRTTPSQKTPGTVSTGSTTTRRKPVSTPSPTRPTPRTEKLVQPTKGKKGISPDANKPSLKDQEEKKQGSVTSKSSKSVKTKSPVKTADDSNLLSSKTSFYNKVTKKSSVVPLESKPFLKKGTGISPKICPAVAKTKGSQPNDSPKSSGSLIHEEKNDANAVKDEATTKVEEADLIQPKKADANIEGRDKDLVLDRDEVGNSSKKTVEDPVPEIEADEDLGISSAAWVEEEHDAQSASSENNGHPEFSISPEIASVAAMSSPRVRHSLSQMLQADNEPDVIEWGNAENPPALVYQRDAPKGFKRLLKFARKSKGEANATGWASPSVFSEGEDDSEEAKASSKKISDALLKKAAGQAKGYEPPKSMVASSFDGGNSSMRSIDYHGVHGILPAQSSASTATILDRLREGQNSASATSGKATRSFFSLSTFRSNKSSEAKLR